jgi:5'-3' exonuclease, C-terminal SAM fold
MGSGDRFGDLCERWIAHAGILKPVFRHREGVDVVTPFADRARYGVEPKQVPDFIALRGDSSDKIPGAPGVGATGAATLLQRYGSLEAALSAGRFPAMTKACGSPINCHDEQEGAAAKPS